MQFEIVCCFDIEFVLCIVQVIVVFFVDYVQIDVVFYGGYGYLMCVQICSVLYEYVSGFVYLLNFELMWDFDEIEWLMEFDGLQCFEYYLVVLLRKLGVWQGVCDIDFVLCMQVDLFVWFGGFDFEG